MYYLYESYVCCVYIWFRSVLFTVILLLMYVCIYVVLFLLLATWLLTHHINI